MLVRASGVEGSVAQCRTNVHDARYRTASSQIQMRWFRTRRTAILVGGTELCMARTSFNSPLVVSSGKSRSLALSPKVDRLHHYHAKKLQHPVVVTRLQY